MFLNVGDASRYLDSCLTAVGFLRSRFGKRKRRSVVFLHHSYYHFFYLARALRERGWDAVTVSLEPPDSPHAIYYHGEDINLFSPDPKRFQRNIRRFFHQALGRGCWEYDI